MPQLTSHLRAPSKERLEALLSSSTTALYAAWREDRVVGLLTLTWYDAPSSRKGWIEDVVVEERLRGEGIGRALMQTALERARQEGIAKLMLTSSPHRHAAHALYRTLGFEERDTTVFQLK